MEHDGTCQAVGEALKQSWCILINAEILPKSDSGIQSFQAPHCRTSQEGEFHAETLPATLDALHLWLLPATAATAQDAEGFAASVVFFQFLRQWKSQARRPLELHILSEVWKQMLSPELLNKVLTVIPWSCLPPFSYQCPTPRLYIMKAPPHSNGLPETSPRAT